MNKPKISVIIPIYNVEKYLRECLDSVINQTLKNIEIICIDDGSTDSSLQILNDYEKRDERIILLQQENAGAGAARNKGLAIAKGEYLSILDADDFFELNMLEETYNHAVKNDSDIIIWKADRYIDLKNKYEQTNWTLNTELVSKRIPASDTTPSNANIFRSMVGWSWDKLFKTTFISKNNIKFQEIKLHNDLLFVFSALAIAEKVSTLDRIFVHQRKRGGTSLSDKPVDWECVFDALYALQSFLVNNKIFYKYERDFKTYSVHLTLHMLNRLDSDVRDNAYCYSKIREDLIPKLELDSYLEDFFYSKEEFKKLKTIINTPVEEYLINRFIKEINHYKAELTSVHSSLTYRVGKLFIAIPCAIRNIYRKFRINIKKQRGKE